MTATADRITVLLAGATGWAGAELARGIAGCTDLQLVAAVARRSAGRNLGEVLNEPRLDCRVFAGAAEALDATVARVFVEFTKPDAAKANILTALAHGCHVVVGTSGLSDEDYGDIDTAARAAQRGVLACGNFAVTAVLALHLAQIAARFIDHFEVIDYAHETKVDAPSGTARELANRLGAVRAATLDVPLAQVRGPPETRGATLGGVQVHALRLPGYVLGVEAIFGAAGERLHIRHEAGASSLPYVAGALLAIRKVGALTGVHRGLDTVMDLS
jgi:4-hydroxy-tetrahydrodipicolinate reductase